MFKSRWLIVAPALLASIFSFIPSVSADPAPGLFTSYYPIDAVPPTQSDSVYPLCGSEVENNINRSYDGEPYLDCTVDLFMVHMTGFITIPEHNTIEFWLASDDGGRINIGGNEWGYWSDQGCSWMESGQIDISAGDANLNLFMYENGGSTCLMLAWNINGQGFEIVPDDAFTTNGESTTTTIPQTTTTIPQTTTTIPQTTTTIPQTTTSSTTTTTTTTIQVPTVTTTTSTVPQTTTTTSTVAETTTTETSTTTTSLPPETVPPITTSIPVSTTTTTQPPETSTTSIPDTIPLPPDTLPEAPQAPETSEPPEKAELPPISDEAVVEALADIEQATPAEVKAIVTELLAFALTTDQAVSVASEPAILEVLTNAEAEQVFEQVAVEELSTEQAVELVAAVQDAPSSVRKAFEAVLNLFQGFADDYVMTNQTVPIKTRRALIALSAVFLVSAPAPIRRNK